MFKKITVVLVIFLVLNCFYSKGQQSVFSVQLFEYIWQPYVDVVKGPSKKRIIIPSEDAAKLSIEKSFIRSIKQRWKIEIPELALSVKPLSIFAFSDTPKFNLKLKDRQLGTWYFFLQIFDKGNSFYTQSKGDSLATTLELKCRIVTGSADSVIFDRKLEVNIYKEAAPANQVVLTKLPAYPDYFTKAFDTIATWLFQIETARQKSLKLKQAYVFLTSAVNGEPAAYLSFESNRENIHHLTSPSFALHMSEPNYEKTHIKRNAFGNTASGGLTLFTGINVNKTKVYEYSADFTFVENSNVIYHCFVNYAERESADREREKIVNSDGSKSYSVKSGDYYLRERVTDSNFLNAITLGKDTLATFGFSYLSNANEGKNYTRFWDGSDSASIMALPHKWNNSIEDDNIILKGEIGGKLFSMRTSKERIVKEFYIDDQLVIIMYGKSTPKTATLFHPLSALQIKLFTILSSLPYSFFNYKTY